MKARHWITEYRALRRAANTLLDAALGDYGDSQPRADVAAWWGRYFAQGDVTAHGGTSRRLVSGARRLESDARELARRYY